MTTIKAMKQALHLLRWTHFGECRTYPGPVPEAQEVDKLLTKAIAAVEAQGVEPKEDFCYCGKDVSLQMVSGGGAPEGYLGKVVLKIDGKYHDYIARPTQPTADHIGDATKLVGERAALITQHRARAESAKLRGPNYSPCISADELLELLDMLAADAPQLSNDDADMLRRKWFGHRNTGHLSFVEAVDATMEGLMAQQVAVPQGWKLVPSEPTQDTLDETDEEVGGYCYSCSKSRASDDDCNRVYRAMLAAAPQPPQSDALAADHAEDVRVMVPMTEEQLATALNSYGSSGLLMRIARAVECHHGIGVKP